MAKTDYGNTAQSTWINPIESRMQRADYYFDTLLKGQPGWYSKSADKQKRRHLFFAIAVIVLGAVISLLQVVEDAQQYIRHLTAGLGALVAILRSLDSLLRPGETWLGYRKASESMKREYRLYVAQADEYADAPDEKAAFRLFAARVETVIAEEQQLFWQFHGKAQPPANAEAPARSPPAERDKDRHSEGEGASASAE